MSCAYRNAACRASVTHRPNTDGNLPTSWGEVDHYPSYLEVTVPDAEKATAVPDASVQTVSAVTWENLYCLLHSPTDVVQEVALLVLGHILHGRGWQCVPNLTDTDIMRLWQSVLSMAECPSPPQDALIRRFSVEAAVRHVTHLFVHCASPYVLEWMWNSIMARTESPLATTNDRYFAAVSLAVRCAFPLWMIPNGMTILKHALHHASLRNPESVMQLVYDIVSLLVTHPDHSGYRLLTADFLTSVLVSLTPDTPEPLRLWLKAVGSILRINPDWFTNIPQIADTIFAACTSEHTDVVQAALDVLQTVAPYAHPRFRPTIEAVIRQKDWQRDHIAICKRATALLLESMSRTHDYDGMYHLIVSACRDIAHPNVEIPDRFIAVEIVHAAMQRQDCLPAIQVFLRFLHDTPEYVGYVVDTIVELLETSSYAPALTEDMIGLAKALIHTPYLSHGADILRHAWGRGNDDQIFQAALSLGYRDKRIQALQPGLYSPCYAALVADHIYAIDPDRSDEHILNGIDEFAHRRQPIPLSVVPAVRQACRRILATYPSFPPIPSSVLNMLWHTDPQASLALLSQIIVHRTVRDEAVHRVIEALCSGVGYGDPESILYLWDHLIRQSTNNVSFTAAIILSQQRDMWHRGSPYVPLAMIRTLYHQVRALFPKQDAPNAIAQMMESLVHGWGTGVDMEILEFLDTVLSDLMAYPQYDTLAHYHPVCAMMQVLRYGWGRGIDHAIGTCLLGLVRWMDQLEQRGEYWWPVTIGPYLLLAITDGGGRMIRREYSDVCEPAVIHDARQMLKTVLQEARQILNQTVAQLQHTPFLPRTS